MGLVSRAVEKAGIPTVTLSMNPEVGKINGVPRIVHSLYSYGSPCGRPGEPEDQLRLIRQALEFLETATEPGEVFQASRR